MDIFIFNYEKNTHHKNIIFDMHSKADNASFQIHIILSFYEGYILRN